jgi:molybdopterin-guanine dinucleotide biosynthesis protein A
MTLGAMILSGGASTRMGEDKAALLWHGRSAVDRLAETARAVGCETVLTVGPGDHGLPRVIDEPRFGGPVGGVMAGAAALFEAGCDHALILAVDAPSLTPYDLAPLLSRPGTGAAFEGLHFPMIVSLAALPDAPADWPMARLADHAGIVRLAVPPEAAARLRGANSPEERAPLLAELAEREAPISPAPAE